MAVGRTNAGGKPEEEKTVTAGTAAVVVNPTSGKTMKKVTVNPTPSQTKTVTAGTGNVNVSPDSGKLLSKVTVAPTPTQSKSVTPSTSQQTVTPDTGKLLSSVVVGAVEDVTPEVTAQTGLIESIKTQIVGKATGANATADKILEGFSAWVNGQLVQGTLKEGIKYESGIITLSANAKTLSIPTNITDPKRVIITTGTEQVTYSRFPTPYILSFLIMQKEPLINYKKTGDYAREATRKTAYSYLYDSGDKIHFDDQSYYSYRVSDGTLNIVNSNTASTAATFYTGMKYKYEIFA